ncbi:hypothetical protein ACFE6N_11550 [Pedobacter sp. BG31]|uniref:hypothetical protein n=1 Tax=Pedobacter sp. BG31 TaxID=3349697 RepID=UPI0035F408CE
MIKKIIIGFLFGLYFTTNLANAQSYGLESFEGKKVKINLFYAPSSGILTTSYLQDSIFINDYMSINTIHVLNKVFLQIEYVKRAGSNEDAMNKIILYVSNGRLRQALHINSLTTYDMRPIEYSLFKVGVKLSGYNMNTYRLNLNIHNEKSVENNFKSNYKFNKTAFLNFDKKNRVFLSYLEPITGYYTFHDSNNNNNKSNFKGNVPVVKIEKDKYYYIKGNWYTKNKNDFYSMSL